MCLTLIMHYLRCKKVAHVVCVITSTCWNGLDHTIDKRVVDYMLHMREQPFVQASK